MERQRWAPLIKDYEGGTLMECYINPNINYIEIPATVRKQRMIVEAKINSMTVCAEPVHSHSPKKSPCCLSILTWILFFSSRPRPTLLWCPIKCWEGPPMVDSRLRNVPRIVHLIQI